MYKFIPHYSLINSSQVIFTLLVHSITTVKFVNFAPNFQPLTCKSAYFDDFPYFLVYHFVIIEQIPRCSLMEIGLRFDYSSTLIVVEFEAIIF
jgi:hypothetical protein